MWKIMVAKKSAFVKSKCNSNLEQDSQNEPQVFSTITGNTSHSEPLTIIAEWSSVSGWLRVTVFWLYFITYGSFQQRTTKSDKSFLRGVWGWYKDKSDLSISLSSSIEVVREQVVTAHPAHPFFAEEWVRLGVEWLSPAFQEALTKISILCFSWCQTHFRDTEIKGALRHQR